MRNELLLSAMLPICGMAGEAYGMPPGDAVPAPKEQPNIILFLVDDMGWQDTSLPFWTQRTKYNDTYHTPNMERMATQGKMFTQAYACSISSPTRVSLFTGMNAARHRVTSWTLRKNTTHEQPDSVMIIRNGTLTAFVKSLAWNGPHKSPPWPKCSKTMAITPFIAEKPTSVLKTLPEPTR